MTISVAPLVFPPLLEVQTSKLYTTNTYAAQIVSLVLVIISVFV